MINGMDFSGTAQTYSAVSGISAPGAVMMIGLNDTRPGLTQGKMILYAITNYPDEIRPNWPYVVVNKYNIFGWKMRTELEPNFQIAHVP